MERNTIERISSNEYGEAAILLSKAFIQTEFSSKAVGGKDEKHRKLLEKGFKDMLEKKPGDVFVAKDGNQVVGVMRMVEWPDCQNSIPRGFGKLMMLIFARSTAKRLFHFRSIWGKHDPKKPHWHIDPIGVLPEKQGQGIGSKLLTHFCNIVDKRNAAAYLETDQDRNVRLYERFDFKVIETEPIFSVTNWFLWRPPRK
jgi:ribosomal protein S18 acetylase RimI-like enzyme